MVAGAWVIDEWMIEGLDVDSDIVMEVDFEVCK